MRHGEGRPVVREAGEGILLSARGINITRRGQPLLLDVDIDLRHGEIVTLVGPNGAGKTTLVKALLGLKRIDRGHIYRRPSLRIGYVPQRFDLEEALPLTVKRFLTLGGYPGSRRAAQGQTAAASLAEVGASHVLNRQLVNVSGGELQRVLLARALLREPDLLMLDEPAQGVDLAGEAAFYELIASLRARYGMGVLLVSHDLHTVMARSNRVICLNRHVCCSGVPETVSQHPEYERLFGPAAARAIALYRHDHDHRHDLSGSPQPATTHDPGPASRGMQNVGLEGEPHD